MDISSLGMAALLRRQPENRRRVLIAYAPFFDKELRKLNEK
jgi:hypothetical protein